MLHPAPAAAIVWCGGQLIFLRQTAIVCCQAPPFGRNCRETKENTMSHEVNGSGAATEGTEGTAEKAKEFAGEATEKAKDFAGEATETVKEFAGEATGKTKELAGGVAENVKGLGARIAGLFKGGK
jgi:uncharacterized protein YjbJ (UPF0337 family)